MMRRWYRYDATSQAVALAGARSVLGALADVSVRSCAADVARHERQLAACRSASPLFASLLRDARIALAAAHRERDGYSNAASREVAA